MKLEAEQIMANWQAHLDLVNNHISEPRKQKIIHMLLDFADVIVMAPASSKKTFHNAFPGGYIDHVNRMVATAIEVAKTWKKTGGVLDFTPEELVFSAMFCCLGKVGDILNPNEESPEVIPNFIPQTNAWRKDNLGELYTQNPQLNYMMTQDRSLYILQKFGVSVSNNEYLAIRLYDGYFNEANKAYYNPFGEQEGVTSNLVYILNMASYMSTRIAMDIEKKEK